MRWGSNRVHSCNIPDPFHLEGISHLGPEAFGQIRWTARVSSVTAGTFLVDVDFYRILITLLVSTVTRLSVGDYVCRLLAPQGGERRDRL